MKNYLFVLAFLCIPVIISAQKLPMNILKDMTPRNIGPGGMSGRVTAIDVVNDNTDIMYVGTASGGVWRSSSGGIKWDPIFDREETASIGAIAIQQSNPSVIWVGTGEGNPRNSLNGGYGIYKSLDGGKNWKLMGLEKTRHIHRVLIDPTDPDVIYVGAIGSPWGEHPERGVFRTKDGGKTWEKILFVNNKTGVADMIMDPFNPNKLLVAMWEHKREPWFFNSGGEGSGIFITHDGGDTWEERTNKDGLPEGDLGRIGLAIARKNPNIIYALVEAKKNALYKSEDGGFNWEKINDKSDIGNRPFYYSELYVDPENENRVYSVFTYVNVSEDGGKNFEQLMPAYGVTNGVHPDHHAWWIHPTDGSFMIDGNDGGLNITHDGGRTWRFVGNLPVAQFYHINVDMEIPYNVYGGMQDNGSWRGPAYVWRSQGIRNDYWQEISFGDGFDVVPDKDDSRHGWTMSQQGYVNYYDWITGNNYSVRPTHPDPDIELRFNWNAAINIDPFDNSTIYFGSQFVHKSMDKGLTWEIISPDLTTNDPNKQKQSESGGLTMDATGAENHTTLLVIEPSPMEENMLWVGTDDGRVHYTVNGGENWVDVSKNIKGLPTGSWIAQIKASNKKRGEALLVANDYRRFNYAPYVYRTKDYGKSWERIVENDDVLSFALCIIEDPIVRELMFLGTDDGLYVSIDAGDSWNKWTHHFPTVSVKDLIIHPREHDLIIGTFGRAAWVLDDIRPLREIAKNKSILNSDLTIFDPPVGYQASYQQPTGSRFGADAIFNGMNRKNGAQITYFFKNKDEGKEKNENNDEEENEVDPDEEMENEKTSVNDSLYMKIYDDGKLIRTLKRKFPDSTGIYKWTWYMDEAGVERPRREIRKIKNEPGGVKVKPGTYTIELNHGQTVTSTIIEVKSDPRLKFSLKGINESYDASKKLEEMTRLVTQSVKQLVESKTTASEFKSKLKEKDKELYKDEIKESANVIKKIDSITAFFIGKEDKRQGITRNREISVIERIRLANRYSSSRPNGLTTTEETLIKHAESNLNNALDRSDKFFQNEWKQYRIRMEKVDLSPFKETLLFNTN